MRELAPALQLPCAACCAQGGWAAFALCRGTPHPRWYKCRAVWEKGPVATTSWGAGSRGDTGVGITVRDAKGTELHRLLGSSSSRGPLAPQVLEQPQRHVHEAVSFGLNASQRVVVPRVPEQPGGERRISAVPAPPDQGTQHLTHRVGTPRTLRAR